MALAEPVALADRLFLIAHHERTGTARVNPRAVALGLAGALLGELVMAQRIIVQDGAIWVVNPRPTSDPLAHVVQSVLIGQPKHKDLKIWLAFFAETSTRDVAKRLERSRHVEAIERRRFVSKHRYYVPTDTNVAAWQSIRLSNMLVDRRPLNVQDTLLCVLLEKVGLLRHVLWNPETSQGALDYLHEMAGFLDASLTGLVSHTEAAIGHLVLAPR